MLNRLQAARYRYAPAVGLAALAIALLVAGVGSARPQEDDGPPSRIQPGERLKISVLGFGAPDAESWFVRRPNGDSRLELPVVGEIDASDLSRFQLETKIADAYNRSILRTRPVIAISRLDYGEDHVLIPALDAAAARTVREAPRRGEPRERGPAAEAPEPAPVAPGEDFQEDHNLLSRPLPEALALKETPLEGAVARLSEAADAEIVVNWDELERFGVTRQTSVSLVMSEGATLSMALQQLSRSARESGAENNTMPLDFTSDDGAIILSTQDDLRGEVKTVVIDIRKLIGFPTDRPANEVNEAPLNPDGPTYANLAEDVIRLIQDLVEPHAWKVNGGSIGAISTLNGQLVVTGTPDMLADVQALLQKLEGRQ